MQLLVLARQPAHQGRREGAGRVAARAASATSPASIPQTMRVCSPNTRSAAWANGSTDSARSAAVSRSVSRTDSAEASR
jgi:hypothetical protein